MGDIWSAVPFLGMLPHFHADPAEGGVPLASQDGHWWWNGRRWTPLVETAPWLPSDADQQALADAGAC